MAEKAGTPRCGGPNGVEQLPLPVRGMHNDLLQLWIRTLRFGRKGRRCWSGGRHLRSATSAQHLVVTALPLRTGGMALAKLDLWPAPADAHMPCILRAAYLLKRKFVTS